MAQPSAEPVSIASLLDDVRPLIAQARRRGERPRYLLLPAGPFEAVRSLKARDAERGVPVMVLGMEIVRGDDPRTAPKVF
jgi:hypothetical protein